MLTIRTLFEKIIKINLEKVLSVYIDTDPVSVSRNRLAAMIWLKDALKNVKKNISEKEMKEFEIAQKKILEEAENLLSLSKSLIIFAAENYFEYTTCQVNVKNEIWWGKPNLGQAEWILEEYRNYGIVKVDSQKLHFYVIGLNQIQEEWEEKIDENTLAWQVKHSKPETILREKAIPGLRGGDTKEIVDRHILEEVQKFWKSSLASINKMKQNYGIKELIIAGLDAQADLYQRCLPLKDTEIIGKITSSESNLNGFLSSAQQLIRQHEKESEMKLINNILNQNIGSEENRLGIKPVLQAIQEGRAGAVAIMNNIDLILLECKDCNYVLPNDFTQCSKCSSKNLQIGSMKTLLPPLLRKYKTQLNIITHNSPQEVISHDGIGVLLRY